MSKKFFATLLIALFFLGACGNQSKASTSIAITMTDFLYSPNTFTVPAGQEITVNATNSGAVKHTFVVMKLGKTVSGSFKDVDRKSTRLNSSHIQKSRMPSSA